MTMPSSGMPVAEKAMTILSSWRTSFEGATRVSHERRDRECLLPQSRPWLALVDFDEPEPLEEFDDDDTDDEDDERNVLFDTLGMK